MAQGPEEYEHVDARGDDEKSTSDTTEASTAADADADRDAEATSLARRQARILDACRRKDIEDLQAIAVSNGGFLSDTIRSQACE